MAWTDWIKDIVKAPIETLALIAGFFLLLLAFDPISYSEGFTFELNAQPIWWLLVLGCVLVGVPLYGMLKPRSRVSPLLSKIENGLRIRLPGDHLLDVVRGSIVEASVNDGHTAVVLPANTSFNDECIHDARSALGAFCGRHFPAGLDEVQSLIRQELHEKHPPESGTQSEYPVGTTIFLDRPLGTDHRMLVTAVTRYSEEDGIHADIESLSASLKSVFKRSAALKLSTLFMPVMGSGHGGLHFCIALNLILIRAIHCILYEGVHHVKHLTVVVHDPDGKRRKEVEEVVRLVAAIV